MILRIKKPWILAALSLAGSALLLNSAVASPAQPLQAQELSFATADGQTITSSSLRGRVSVLMFSGVQDPQCRDEIKALEALSERYHGQPVSIYWVSVNSPSEMPNDRLSRPCGLTTSVQSLRLSDINTFKRISGRTAALPTMIVLNKLGQPYGRPRTGFNPNSDFVNDVAELVDSLLAQK